MRATSQTKQSHSAPKHQKVFCSVVASTLKQSIFFKISILSLTGGTLYLLARLTGRLSVLGRHCSAKTQQHMIREAHILTAVGSRAGAHGGWLLQRCVRCAMPGVTLLQDPGRLLLKYTLISLFSSGFFLPLTLFFLQPRADNTTRYHVTLTLSLPRAYQLMTC